MPKRFSKRKLQAVNTKTNRPIHPQPASSKTYNPYAVLVPFTSVFLLELTVNTCRKKERPPTTLVAILNLRARSCGHASTNQTFFASERVCSQPKSPARNHFNIAILRSTKDSRYLEQTRESKNHSR